MSRLPAQQTFADGASSILVFACVVATTACAALPAAADVPWHADVATARQASGSSGKPVLAVFTASWSPECARFAEKALASPETAALVAACFEPVLVDVDASPGVTKRLKVDRVPSACVLRSDGVIVARFACPEPPAEFIAVAARAARDAAVAAKDAAAAATMASAPVGTTTEQVSEAVIHDDREKPALATGESARSVAAGVGEPLAAPEAAALDAGSGSISQFKDKVRQLSDFATTSPAPAAAGLPAAAAAEPAAQGPAAATATDPPALPRTPPAWPAEQPASTPAFTNTAEQPVVRPTISPAPTTTGSTWLSSPAASTTAAAAAVPADPQPAATATDSPKAPASSWSAFVAAFQKPFSIFSKPAKPTDPATMPPARSTSPLAVTTAPAQPPAATAAAAPAATADPYGSMPLGLEGYCPVTLAERGVWTEGRAQWGVRHRGRTYLFAGPEQQQAFLATPDRYAPALSGDDPVLAFEQGKSTPGRRAFGVTYQSRMYLFASPESRAAFAASPERYTSGVLLAERPAHTEATRRY